MSRFYSRMEALSKKPSDYKQPPAEAPMGETPPSLALEIRGEKPRDDTSPGGMPTGSVIYPQKPPLSIHALGDTPVPETPMGHRGAGSLIDPQQPPLSIHVAGDTPVPETPTGVSSTGLLVYPQEVHSSGLPRGDTPRRETPTGVSAGDQWRSTRGSLWQVGRVVRIGRIQDCLSHAERSIYEILWNTPNSGNFHVLSEGNVRRIQASWMSLARVTSMHEKTLRKSMIPGLIAKYLITIEQESQQHKGTPSGATIYEICSYQEALARQRAFGYTHFVRNGRSFELVKLERPLGEPPMGDSVPEGFAPMNRPPRMGTSPRVGVSRAKPVGVSLPHPIRLKPSSPNDDDVRVRKLLQAQLPSFDDHAVDILWRDCRDQISDITPEEIARLFRDKLPVPRGVDNPNGFLIRAVARSCTLAAIGALRQGREVPLQTPIEHAAEDLQGLLDDPNTPEDIRQFIQQRMRKT